MNPFKANRCPRCCFSPRRRLVRRANTAGQSSRPLPRNNIQQRASRLTTLSLLFLNPRIWPSILSLRDLYLSGSLSNLAAQWPHRRRRRQRQRRPRTPHPPSLPRCTEDPDQVSPTKVRRPGLLLKPCLGCFTCRLRRKKCDEGKPKCRACRHLGLDCEYKRPQWWSNNETRRKQKEFIKTIVKRTKTTEKTLAAQNTCRTLTMIFVHCAHVVLLLTLAQTEPGLRRRRGRKTTMISTLIQLSPPRRAFTMVMVQICSCRMAIHTDQGFHGKSTLKRNVKLLSMMN